MTKSTITRDELNEVITTYGKHHIAHRMAYALLAAMDSEPAAWRVRFKLEGQPGSNFNKFFENRKAMDDVVSLHELGGFNIDVTPLYRHAQTAPVVRCPFPCGWDNLNKLAIQDAALVARGLVEGELTTEAHRQAAISNNDRLLKVISAFRAAMLNGGKS